MSEDNGNPFPGKDSADLTSLEYCIRLCWSNGILEPETQQDALAELATLRAACSERDSLRARVEELEGKASAWDTVFAAWDTEENHNTTGVYDATKIIDVLIEQADKLPPTPHEGNKD